MMFNFSKRSAPTKIKFHDPVLPSDEEDEDEEKSLVLETNGTPGKNQRFSSSSSTPRSWSSSSSTSTFLRFQGFMVGACLAIFISTCTMYRFYGPSSFQPCDVKEKSNLPPPSSPPTLPPTTNNHNNNINTIKHLNGDYQDGCTTLLNTFPNSGTTWTQAVFSSATGLLAEAVYKEGPPSNLTGAFIYGGGGKNNGRLPDQSLGECRFVKSHQRLSHNQMPTRYQRAVILYRDPEENLGANLRYLQRQNFARKPNVIEPCQNVSMDFTNFEEEEPELYSQLSELHFTSHKRFYCHAQDYNIPRMFITYANLMHNPNDVFSEILVFTGFPDANVTKGMEENPPHVSDVMGIDEYIHVEREECDGLNEKFAASWNKTHECVRMMARTLQYIY